MKPSQEDINLIKEIKELPVNLSINGLTVFMMIGQLQSRSPRIKPILDQGWHPEFDISTNEKIVDVHNVFSLYENADENGNAVLSVSSRPQDWGDPRWHYEFIKFEWKQNNTLYIQNAHIWTTTKYSPPELLGNLGQAIGMIMQPGKKQELCDRFHLHEDDFWDKEWGEMPPYYMGSSTDDDYFDYG